MNILVIGGTGFIGSALINKLLLKNYNITMLSNDDSGNEVSVNHIKCDRKDTKYLKNVLNEEKYDVIFDFCCTALEDLNVILEVLHNKIGQYVLCSTVSTYDFNSVTTLPITEDYRLKDASISEYGGEKGACEKVLKEVVTNSTIIRPCYVYGPKCKDYRLEYLIDRIMDDRPILLLNKLDILMHFIYIDDLVDVFIKVMDNKDSYGKIFNACSDEYISLDKLIKLLAMIIGNKGKIVDVERILKFIPKELQSKLYLNKVYDFSICFSNNKLKNMVDWKPLVNMEAGLRNTYKCHKKTRNIDYQFDDKILKILEESLLQV